MGQTTDISSNAINGGGSAVVVGNFKKIAEISIDMAVNQSNIVIPYVVGEDGANIGFYVVKVAKNVGVGNYPLFGTAPKVFIAFNGINILDFNSQLLDFNFRNNYELEYTFDHPIPLTKTRNVPSGNFTISNIGTLALSSWIVSYEIFACKTA